MTPSLRTATWIAVSTVRMEGTAEAVYPHHSGFKFTLVLSDLFSFPAVTKTENELHVCSDPHKLVYLGSSGVQPYGFPGPPYNTLTPAVAHELLKRSQRASYCFKNLH